MGMACVEMGAVLRNKLPLNSIQSRPSQAGAPIPAGSDLHFGSATSQL